MEKDKKIERVAGMLEEASKLLRTPTNVASSIGSEGRPQETGGSSSIRIQESLQRAQNMLRNSSSTGLCRRLKRPERLRLPISKVVKLPPFPEIRKRQRKRIRQSSLHCIVVGMMTMRRRNHIV